MKQLTVSTCVTACILLSAVSSVSYAASHSKITMIKPSQIHWKSGPRALPKGFQYIVLAGDPSRKGMFIMRLKIPANFKVPTHYHSSPDNLTVISGALRLVYGKRLNKSKVFKAGSFISVPPNVKHFTQTLSRATVVQLSDMGPWKMNYADPKMDPRKQ